MKRIFSSTLLCTLLLNSFISSVYATETSQASEGVIQTETTSSVLAKDTALSETSQSLTDFSEQSTEKATTNTTTSSITQENSTAYETTSSSDDFISTKESNQMDPKEDVEIGKQGTDHKKGIYAMQPTTSVFRRARGIGIADVYANDPDLPRKDFIDVSSWNGTISVADYQKIKSYGITGVSVKLTEGTSYINPYAKSQIDNAKAAGLNVSAYHYSLYTSTQTAQAEANYFAKAASNAGLAKHTILFNDAEDPTLINNGRNAQNNSLAFNQQLKKLGFSNAALYIGRYWIDSGYINPASFGKERVWVAQYPYTPNQTMQWNNEYGAWQWSSLMYFPGIANYRERPFDISMSYSSFFNTHAAAPDLNNYYTSNPGKVIVKQNDYFYNDVNFTSRGKPVKKNSLITVKSIQMTANGVPRLFTDHGYLTANKSYVVAAKSNIDSYFTTNPKMVRLKIDDYFYADTAFKKRLNKVTKGTIVEVTDLAYTDSGVFRLKTNAGYLSASKSIVEEYRDYSKQYYIVNPEQVIVKVDDRFYKDVEFKEPSEAVSAGTVLKVVGIEEAANGVPRLKTSHGYFTANKNYVVATVPTINKYYTENPQQVMLKTDDCYYKDVNFTQKGEPLTKNTIIEIENMVYTSEGIPRLKTAKGYLTANRSYVQQVPSTIDNYYYFNPMKVAMKANDYFYKDLDFNQKERAISKDTLVDILGVAFTKDGYPRLRTNDGYLTANKDYVVKLTNHIDQYFTENPHRIIMLTKDNYYLDVDFLHPGQVIAKDTIIDVLGIDYTSNGTPRLKTAKGYITANKNYVTAAGNSNNNYFVTNPQKVKFLVDDFYYKDLAFTQKGKKIKKGTVVHVEAIEYTSFGVPRLKVAGGYITANKWYIEKAK
ncbi:DUF5776 domain-containing protein [Enterococcus ratti]|uniref:DUF5776 domain-containing protein n=1 Tax=Enterococcus ratti TaxID=150033 RepID=UPI00351157F2